MSDGRIVTIIPATGWRQVYAIDPGNMDYGLETLPDEQLMAVVPIACFALVHPHDERESDTVQAITAQDWPSYFYKVDEQHGHVDYLGPGQELTPEHREEALRQIRAARKKAK